MRRWVPTPMVVVGLLGGLAAGAFALGMLVGLGPVLGGPVDYIGAEQVHGAWVRAWLINARIPAAGVEVELRPGDKDPGQVQVVVGGSDVLSCDDHTFASLVGGLELVRSAASDRYTRLDTMRCRLAPPKHLDIYEMEGSLVDQGLCPAVFSGTIEKQLHDALFRPLLSAASDIPAVLEPPTVAAPIEGRAPPQGYKADEGGLDLAAIAWCSDPGVDTNCLIPDDQHLFYCGKIRADEVMAEPGAERRRIRPSDVVFSWAYVRARSFSGADADVSTTCARRPASLHRLAVANDVLTSRTVEAWRGEQVPRPHTADISDVVVRQLSGRDDRVCVAVNGMTPLSDLLRAEVALGSEEDPAAQDARAPATTLQWINRVVEAGLSFPVFNALAGGEPDGRGRRVLSPVATGLQAVIGNNNHPFWTPICYGPESRAADGVRDGSAAARTSCRERHEGVLTALLGATIPPVGSPKDLWRLVLGSGAYRVDREAGTADQAHARGITLVLWDAGRPDPAAAPLASKDDDAGGGGSSTPPTRPAGVPPFSTVSYVQLSLEGGADRLEAEVTGCEDDRYCVVTNVLDAKSESLKLDEGSFCDHAGREGQLEDISAVVLTSSVDPRAAECVTWLYRSVLTDPTGQVQADTQLAILGALGYDVALSKSCLDPNANYMALGHRALGLLPANAGILPDITAAHHTLPEQPQPTSCPPMEIAVPQTEPWLDAARVLATYANEKLGMQITAHARSTADIERARGAGVPTLLLSSAGSYSNSAFPTLLPLLDVLGEANPLRVAPLSEDCDRAWFDLYERGLTPVAGLPRRNTGWCQDAVARASFAQRLMAVEDAVWSGQAPILPLVFVHPRWSVLVGNAGLRPGLKEGLKQPAAFARPTWPAGTRGW